MPYAQKVVKSVGRTLEVLEYFGPDRQDAATSEIASELGYPISSTAELLWSIVELGYLSFDPDTRKFRPTIKFPLLGYWVLPGPMSRPPLLELMSDIAKITECTVALATPERLSVRYLHVVTKEGPTRQKFKRVDGKCMLHSAIGRLALSRLSSSEASLAIRRINSELTSGLQVRANSIMLEIEHIKERGYSMSVEGISPDYGCVAIPIPAIQSGQELILGVGAPAHRIRSDWMSLTRELTTRTQGMLDIQIEAH